jgi:hypothetical protein
LNWSQWEGVSFWARRSPDSQNSLRVLAGDRYTDDDVNFLMYSTDPKVPRYCERIRECACSDHRSCLLAVVPDGGVTPPPGMIDSFNPCFNSLMGQPINGDTSNPVPATYCDDGHPHALVSGDVTPGGSSIQCNSCDRNRCNEEWPAYPGKSDPAFSGRPCLPFTYRNGVSSSFCFNPDFGERPAEPDQQCGDHWTKTVALTNEWQFFTVRFDQSSSPSGSTR